ncbi:MAG: hypothetical protein HOP18_26030 [Deltaproteobacteria bacterium]|nr:hypothetical protein [Deltaproteobacteria bacterium]
MRKEIDDEPPIYPERTVRLVDGGVHDNQGVASLLEQGCSIFLVSDASGQMASQNEPSSGILGSPLRAFSIFQARVREAQFQELDARRRASLLRGFRLQQRTGPAVGPLSPSANAVPSGTQT